MLLSATITEKSFGNKFLHTGVAIEIQDKEKIGLIGRNGTGKSTLFNILSGEDKDFQGEVQVRKGSIIVSSRQEHHGLEDKTVLEYIQGDLPEYRQLVHIIDTYPATMGSVPRKIQEFTNALDRFSELGYYQLENEIEQAFEAYQIDPAYMHQPLGSLSGGQKRMIELIKVQRSRGHLALIDEPTNHMDYIAKESFIKWLRATNEAVVVITHDRDVLGSVDRIIEIRDGISYTFNGNYDKYLKTNKNQMSAQVNTYDLTQKRIENLKEDVIRFRRMKEKSRTPGTIRRFKSQEQKAKDELEKLSALDKPSFWIDQESAGSMHHKLADTYDKYKATNIRVRTRAKATDQGEKLLVQATDLSLGYDSQPLFSGISFSLHEGERLRLHGRNGAGKTTLVQAIMAQVQGTPLLSQCFAGKIHLAKELRIGLYEQEISQKYLSLTLSGAVEQILRDKDLPINPQHIKQLLGDYLFNPAADGDMPVMKLSGGQKARLQLIAMLASDPQILIIDEPTNHLDLPSIEELENALMQYHGAIIYISHDSFFVSKLGGEVVQVGQ
ncbi:MAG TPA: ABC-F family ATP-binding cassette domain-containing protein [Verrucomicrobiae bacterium]|nr:ABC-F family ATP-binding cassette domain-containing protein [Verrucomicrobiae bacterium]